MNDSGSDDSEDKHLILIYNDMCGYVDSRPRLNHVHPLVNVC